MYRLNDRSVPEFYWSLGYLNLVKDDCSYSVFQLFYWNVITHKVCHENPFPHSLFLIEKSWRPDRWIASSRVYSIFGVKKKSMLSWMETYRNKSSFGSLPLEVQSGFCFGPDLNLKFDFYFLRGQFDRQTIWTRSCNGSHWVRKFCQIFNPAPFWTLKSKFDAFTRVNLTSLKKLNQVSKQDILSRIFRKLDHIFYLTPIWTPNYKFDRFKWARILQLRNCMEQWNRVFRITEFEHSISSNRPR